MFPTRFPSQGPSLAVLTSESVFVAKHPSLKHLGSHRPSSSDESYEEFNGRVDDVFELILRNSQD